MTDTEKKKHDQIRQRFADAACPENRNRVAVDPDRLQLHLMPPVGWLNDPNGLCEMNGINHIYYQYTPMSPKGDTPKGWGHFTTENWVKFQEQEPAFYPDCLLDEGGAYSGSALPVDGRIHYFYTGNRKLAGDYDYINAGRQHWTIHSDSADGMTMFDKDVLLTNADYPGNLSCHVRDPKVWQEDGEFRMVLGARTLDSEGQAEIFTSPDLSNWSHLSTITPETPFGYMWECPDIFDLGGRRFLITCPQGVAQDGLRYENLYQNGYFELDPDLSRDQKVKNFHEFDHGFDFYAPQTFEDEQGRRILIAWMGIPDVPYTNREADHGWQHALTLPRELYLHHGHLAQYPLQELETLRSTETRLDLQPGIPVQLPGRVCEIQLQPKEQAWTLKLRQDAVLSYKEGILALSLGKSGRGRDIRHVKVPAIWSLSIFSDSSSLEVFVNGGLEALTTRLYDEPDSLQLESSVPMQGVMFGLDPIRVQALSDNGQKETLQNPQNCREGDRA